MSKSIEIMKELVNFLPKKDIKLGIKFIEERNFESLLELVDSAIYKVKRNFKSECPKEEYNLDLDSLINLHTEVSLYLSQLNIPSYDNFTDYEDTEIEDDIY